MPPYVIYLSLYDTNISHFMSKLNYFYNFISLYVKLINKFLSFIDKNLLIYLKMNNIIKVQVKQK